MYSFIMNQNPTINESNQQKNLRLYRYIQWIIDMAAGGYKARDHYWLLESSSGRPSYKASLR